MMVKAHLTKHISRASHTCTNRDIHIETSIQAARWFGDRDQTNYEAVTRTRIWTSVSKGERQKRLVIRRSP